MCPICHGDNVEMVAAICQRDVWSWYHDHFDFQLTQEVRDAHQSVSGSFLLQQCMDCDVQYFDPTIAGSADFYAELTTHVPYQDKWEFGVVIRRLRGDETVLDIGCGSGRFLRMAQAKGCTAIGIDHNPSAIAELNAAGIENYRTIEEFLMVRSRLPDVVTAFQILEHLEHPNTLSMAIGTSLAPSGEAFVAVPNRHRAGRPMDEPLDHPPHHVTRWSVAALQHWGMRGDLQLARVWYESPDLYPTRAGVEAWVSNLNASFDVAALGDGLGRLASKRPIHRMLSATRVLQRIGVVGHTILGRFEGR